MTKWLLIGGIGLLAMALILPRIATDDPTRWHVDPTTAKPSERPNSYRVADHDAVFMPLSPEDALSRFDRIARSDPRVTMIAGEVAQAHATYVQRSAVFGFPDYISVLATPAKDGSRLSVYSRSRFGYSDLGANKARIERWLGQMETVATRTE